MERETQSSAKQSMEKKAWDKLWTRVGPEWLLYACSHGSMDAVKFLVEMGGPVNYEKYR